MEHKPTTYYQRLPVAFTWTYEVPGLDGSEALCG